MLTRLLFCICLILLGCCLEPASLLAQDPVVADSAVAGAATDAAAQATTPKERPPFGWYKLLIVAVFYLLWVFLSDLMNQDLLRWGRQMQLDVNVWNMINVLCFALAGLLVLAVPIFWASLPVFILASFVPMLVYRTIRKGKVAEDDQLAFQVAGGEAVYEEPVLAQDEGVLMEFTAAGESSEEQSSNLIRARQSAAFVPLKDLLVKAITSRADLVAFDFTRQAVAGKMFVDGTWHNLPHLDRPTGDAMLYSLKCLAGLNPADRRSQQTGKFSLKWLDMSLKASFELSSAGVPTGERVQLKALRTGGKDLSLVQLGMWPEMKDRLVEAMTQPGAVLISAPPRTGLTSTWRGALQACDRLTREYFALVPAGETETDVENIIVEKYSPEKLGEIVRALWLRQPDVIAFPELLKHPKFVNEFLNEALEEQKSIFIRSQAESSIEALLSSLAKAPDKALFAKALNMVSGQRLVRRLCDTCKQPMNLRPEAITKLGGDPRAPQTIFNHFQLPPPEQRVDEKGQPIEIPPCPVCQGIGYIGRIAVYDLIQVDKGLRELLLKNPTSDKIEAYLQSRGQLSLLQQAYRLVLVGVTSIAEVQRVFAPKRVG
jgi:type II secretory ATPase GspE/PulE/Tfp pilus assembly ATPase PilB-like protein